MRSFLPFDGQALSWLPFCLLACLVMVGCGQTEAPSPQASDSPPATASSTDSRSESSAEPVTGIVTVEIQGDSDKQSFELPDVAAGTTVEEIMRSLTEIDVVIEGSGSSAFIDRIGDLGTSANEGWLFSVDGEFATQGVGSTYVDPPATISWSFGGME